MKKLQLRKGFTLVELLIVIALLGALAIGLIGALDPFEQLKKGTDTGTRNNVSEVHSSVIRYYALKGVMPWCPIDGSYCDVSAMSGIALNVSPMSTALAAIVASGELKSNFTTLNSTMLSKIFVTGTTTTVSVCFTPDSKSFRSDVNTKYTKQGVVDTTPCDTTLHVCYWCVE